ncbi:MAG TPA: Zn-ribbon domain-containing OB-fold protein [Bordetella sp.]|uniref:Zn-ribbon domain-containing OB-fold protein n=1 Tax=Bordetella sp. TaxID=28081 RepID=UPI002ECFB2B6
MNQSRCGSDAAGAELHYRQALAQGRFLIQRCNACARAVFYPRMICPHCGGDVLVWEEPSGRGTVYSTTVVRRKADAGGDYNVALIDLEEGVRMMSRVDGLAPEAVHIGMAVQARVQSSESGNLVVFVPAGGQA